MMNSDNPEGRGNRKNEIEKSADGCYLACDTFFLCAGAGYKRNNGNYVKIKHNSIYTTQYLHMSKIASGMKSGKYVTQGEVIGFVGSTGLATGPHVCFRFWKNGQQVNHRKEEFPSSHPVDEDRLVEYQKIMLHMKSMVDAISIETDQSQIAAGI